MNFKKEIKKDLFSFQDKNYQKFHKSLCPNTNNIIGVKVPVLKDYAKSLLKKYDFEDLYNNIDNNYYEEVLLKGLLICFSKRSFESIKDYIGNFIPLIDNWAICDIFCASLKFSNKEKRELRKFILKYKNSNKEFELRFMIVMILDHYIEEEYLDENFKMFESIKSNDYYVEMAISWALSISFIKYYDRTYKFFKNAKLSKFVHNKTISKVCDSKRVSDEKKSKLKKLRLA